MSHHNPLTAEQLTFALEEFKCLRTEIVESSAAQRNLEVLCIGALAAIYSFLLTHLQLKKPMVDVAWFVPVLIPLYGVIRSAVYRAQMQVVGNYIRQIEKAIRPGTGFWEQNLYSKRQIPLKDKRIEDWQIDIFTYTSIVMFFLLLVLTAAAFVLKLSRVIPEITTSTGPLWPAA